MFGAKVEQSILVRSADSANDHHTDSVTAHVSDGESASKLIQKAIVKLILESHDLEGHGIGFYLKMSLGDW